MPELGPFHKVPLTFSQFIFSEKPAEKKIVACSSTCKCKKTFYVDTAFKLDRNSIQRIIQSVKMLCFVGISTKRFYKHLAKFIGLKKAMKICSPYIASLRNRTVMFSIDNYGWPRTICPYGLPNYG